MQRLEFLGALGGAAVGWPRAIHAQEAGCIYRLGTMTPSLKSQHGLSCFFDELRAFGFVEGQNLKVDGGGYGLRDEQLPMHPPGADRRRRLQEGPRMKKTFSAFVVVATIAGSLAATPASAQRGVAAGVAAPGYYYGPGYYGSGHGHYDYFGSCEWVTQRFWGGHGWRSAGCESAADPRLRRD
jgi:hypothetical protein